MHISANSLSVHVDRLETGGWFIRTLSYGEQHIITEGGSEDYAAGWEVSLNDFRYTPHVAEVIADGIERCGTASEPELILKNNCTDGSACIYHHLRLRHGALEQWLEIHNNSQQVLEISNCNFAQLKLDPNFLNGLQVWHNYASNLSPVLDNYLELHDPAVCMHHATDNWGVAIVNMAPAQTHRLSTGLYTSLGYSNGVMPFLWRLDPASVFSSDLGVVIPYVGAVEIAGQDAIYDYTRLALRANRALPQALSYCSWEPFARDIDAQRIGEQIQQADDLGFECFIIDDGWQLHAGDWTVDFEKFPQGLRPIADDLHQRNMQLGLWISLATISEHADAATAFDDCIIRDQHGVKRETHVFEGTLGIACLATHFAQHIETRLHDLISDLDLRYIKIDLPVVYDVYHRPAIVCHATNHDHAAGSDYTLKAYRAIQNISRNLKRKFPQLIIDLTFELWGGWHAIDPALLACADVSWLSNLSDADAANYGCAQARHLAASRSRVIPPAHLVVGNLRCNGAYPLESVASSFASYPMLLGDLSKIPESKRTIQRVLLAWFREQSQRSDLSAYYQCLLEAGKSAPSQDAFTGFLRCDHSGNGIIGIFRNAASHDAATVMLTLPSCIDEDVCLTLSEFNSRQEMKLSSADILRGIPLYIDETHGFKLYVMEVS